MANPQLENGHTKIANEIMDALCRYRIPGEARQVFDCIVRHTWGWNKKTDKISLSQFSIMTGLLKRNVLRGVSWLTTHNIVIHDNGSYCIQKDYEQWNVAIYPQGGKKNCSQPRQRAFSATTTRVLSHDNKSLSSTTPTKDSKDIITKDSKDIISVFDFWNTKKIVVHRELTDTMIKHIKKKLSFYDVKEITSAIDTYKVVIDDDNCWLNYRWSLSEFLMRGLEKCMDRDSAMSIYRKVGGNHNGTQANRKPGYAKDYTIRT